MDHRTGHVAVPPLQDIDTYTSDRGKIIAALTPCTPRAITIAVPLFANPAAAEETPKINKPMTMRFRVPIVSPKRPAAPASAARTSR